MQKSPKNHHYVPECYLNSFANYQKVFWKKRIDNNHISPSSPAKVCYEEDGNKIRNIRAPIFNNLIDEYTIEKNAFKAQENNYQKILAKIIRYSQVPLIVDKIQYHLFIETLITIKRRNPISRKKIINEFTNSRSSSQAIEIFRSELRKEVGEIAFSPEMDNQIKIFFEHEARKPEILHDMYLSAFLNKNDYTTIANITNQLYSLKQFILHAPLNSQFITSDNPGFTKCSAAIINLGGFGGDFAFYFPLTPQTCLLISSASHEQLGIIEKTIYPVLLDAESVTIINSFTKTVAGLNIFSYSKQSLEKM